MDLHAIMGHSDAFAALFSSIPPGTDLNSTAPLSKEVHIPAVFLGIPFPPAEGFSEAHLDDKHAHGAAAVRAAAGAVPQAPRARACGG